MLPIARSFGAVVAGMVISFSVVYLLELVAQLVHPLPAGIDVSDLAQVKAHYSGAPVTVMLLILFGWVLGPFVGGVVATRIADRDRAIFPWVVMSLFLMVTLRVAFAIDYPLWMKLGGLLGIPAAAWWAARLAPPDAPR